MDLRVCGASSSGQADNSRASFVGSVGPGDISEGFEAPKKLVHGLLAYTGAFGERARTNPIRAWKLQHRHMRHPELLESGRIELVDNPTMNGLSRNPQEGANQHLRNGRHGTR
jgi:hypothetical protein